jgi:hypothetical protein
VPHVRLSVLQSIGSEDDVSALGKFSGIGLVRVARQAHDLALSQIKLAVLLMVGKTAGAGRSMGLGRSKKDRMRSLASTAYSTVCRTYEPQSAVSMTTASSEQRSGKGPRRCRKA